MSVKNTILFLLLSYNAFSQSFGDFASGVKINNTIYNTTASAQIHQIDPSSSASWLNSSNLGNFGEQTTCSKITGAELKTFKNVNANVCSATLFWRVYLTSAGPSGSFNSVPLTTISECNLSSSPVVFYDNLGPCGSRDQKWKDYSLSINFTQGLTVGNYVFEVYYSYTGSNTSSSTCETTKYINNGGNNFKANFTIVKPTTAPSVSQTSLCEGDTLTLNANVSNGVAPHTYSWTGPNGFVSNAASPVISNITLAQAGIYSVVITDSCGSTSIIQSTPNVTVIAKTTPLFSFGTTFGICAGDSVPILPTTSSNSYTGSWNPSTVDNTQNNIYNFTTDNGQCATNTSFTVNVTQPTIATFNSIAAFCKGTIPPALPTTSNQAYTGAWSPSTIDNTQTLTYQFIPNNGQCASPGNLTVSVFDPNTTPTFSFGTSITSCANTTQTILPTTSSNGIIGSWNPSTIDYSITGVTLFTFTPNAGQCAINTTLTVTINPNITPTFNAITPICAGDTSAILPNASNEGITGTWSPTSVNNTQSTVYTFIPSNGLCATTGSTLSINVNQPATATFNALPSICNGGVAPSLPITSNEGFTGTWLPNVVDNTQTHTYIFSPTSGQCASQGNTTVTVNINITPSFTLNTTICFGESLLLPLVSNEGITGTWTPSTVDNTQSGDYTFQPDSGQCATSISKHITVNQLTTSTFLSPAPICNGTTAPVLPLTSLNGITGTWFPAVVDNTQNGSYLFTPDSNQCAANTTLNVTVYQNCSFGSFASAVWLTNCADNDFFNTVGSGSSIIGPAQNIFPTTDFGTYLANSGTFKLRGAEVKTFKNALANVCSARLHYRIYPQSGTPGPFLVLNLSFFDGCSGGSFSSGGPCNAGDQKWQTVLNDSQSPLDLTAFPSGDYVIEVYYDVTGDVNSTSQCDDTIVIDNNGANFIATYTLQNNPTNTFSNPTSCDATDGSITFQNLAPTTSFSLTYTDDSNNIGPIIITSNSSGEYVLNGLNAGSYTNFSFVANGCSFPSAGNITLQNPIITPTFNAIGPICSGDTSVTLPTISNEGITGTWSPAFNNSATTTYSFTPDGSSSSSTNLIVNGDFSLGNSNFTTDYQYITNAGLGGVQKAYGIVSIANSWFQFFQPCVSNAPSAGNMMVIDGSTSNGGTDKVWGQTVTVVPNKTYTFSYWLQTIATPNQALIDVKINGVSIGTSSAPNTNCQTAQYTYTWNSGTNTSAQIAIYDRIFVANGNDFSLDDISFIQNNVTNNQCATGTTLTVTVNQPTVSTFDAIPSICSGGIAPSLPITSLEGFTGTWSPNIVDNSQTLTYHFTPAPGQCASQGSVTINVTPNVTPTFTIGTSVTACAGFSPQVLLPTTSNEGITGTWNPSTLDYSIVGITVYTFTPNANQCATNGTLTATINANVTPTFSTIPFQSICSGATLNALPTTSIEGIIGTWSPALNNTQTTPYTFIPNTGQCALQTVQSITVNPNVTPTFTALAPICVGDTSAILPITSIEGITGTWAPATIDNTQTLTYQFSPSTGLCATTGSTVVTVQSGFDFTISGGCVDNNFVLEVTPVNATFDASTANYSWYTSAGQMIGSNLNTLNVTEYLNSTVAIETLPITFNVTVTTPNGCYRNKPKTLTQIFCGIQKGISANNDGLNDFFDLQLLNVKHLEIFNRYGMKVYSKSNYTNEWIGQSDKGDELPDGTYYYVIEFNSSQASKTGWIYINRQQ